MYLINRQKYFENISKFDYILILNKIISSSLIDMCLYQLNYFYRMKWKLNDEVNLWHE